MKKVILIFLTLGMLVTSTGIVGNAREINDVTTGEISLDVRLGFDPTDPNPPDLPTNPDNWIAVTVPDRIALVSNGSATPSHTTVLEVAHRVENRSVHAVTVSVEDFDLDDSLVSNHFNTLNLVADATNVGLINANTLINLTRTAIFTLNGTYENGVGNITGGNVNSTFNFAGTLTPPTTGTVVHEANVGSITLHFSSHGPTAFVPNNPHETFEDPDTGTVWRVLVPATDPRGGIGNALIITEYVHMPPTRYHSTVGFTLFQSAEAQTTIRNWWNNSSIVGETMREVALDYEFQDASGNSIPRTSTVAGAGIEVDRGNNTANNSNGDNATPSNTTALRGLTRPLPPRVGSPEPFVLSISEANTYFSGDTGVKGRQTGRIGALTTNTIWWLRSPNSSAGSDAALETATSRHSAVDTDGSHDVGRVGDNSTGNRGFRPALWVHQ